MSNDDPVNLDAFRARRDDSPLFTCPNCGSQWWRATVAIEDGAPTSMALADIACHECGTVTPLGDEAECVDVGPVRLPAVGPRPGPGASVAQQQLMTKVANHFIHVACEAEIEAGRDPKDLVRGAPVDTRNYVESSITGFLLLRAKRG